MNILLSAILCSILNFIYLQILPRDLEDAKESELTKSDLRVKDEGNTY